MKTVLLTLAIVFSGMLMQAQEKELLPLEKITDAILGKPWKEVKSSKRENIWVNSDYGKVRVKPYVRKGVISKVAFQVVNYSPIQDSIEKHRDYDRVDRGTMWTDYWYDRVIYKISYLED